MRDLITSDFSNHFESLMKAFNNDFFEGFNVKSPCFEDKGDFFELRIPVEKSVQISNVKVRVEDTLTLPVVTVAYAQRTKTSQSTYPLARRLKRKNLKQGLSKLKKVKKIKGVNDSLFCFI